MKATFALLAALLFLAPAQSQPPDHPATQPVTRAADFPRHALNPPLTPGQQQIPENAALVHAPTGLHFPPQLAGIRRTSAFSYDAETTNLSAGYRDPETRLTASLYLYPATAEPAELFKAEVRQIEQVWKGAQRFAGFEMSDLGPPLLGSVHAIVLTCENPPGNSKGPVTTWLGLAEVQSQDKTQRYFAKLRATAASEHAQEAQVKLLLIASEWLTSNGFVLGEAEPGGDALPPMTKLAAEPEIVDIVGRGEQRVEYGVAARHVPTGVAFPPTLGGAPLVEVTSYNDAASNVSGGYNELVHGLAVTLYVYPLKESVQDMFDDAMADIRAKHPDWETLGSIKIVRGEAVIGSGFAGRFESQGPDMGYLVPVLSDVWLFPLVEAGRDGQRFVVKMRATFPKERTDAIQPMLESILIEWLNLKPQDVLKRPPTRPAEPTEVGRAEPVGIGDGRDDR